MKLANYLDQNRFTLPPGAKGEHLDWRVLACARESLLAQRMADIHGGIVIQVIDEPDRPPLSVAIINKDVEP